MYSPYGNPCGQWQCAMLRKCFANQTQLTNGTGTLPKFVQYTLGFFSQLILPRCVLGLLQQQCLIFRAQSLLPGIEVILEASHGHLAPTGSGSVHNKATLARQTAQHPGAERQQHHGKEVHGTGHSWCARKKSRRFNVQSCTSDAMNLNQCPTNLTVGMEQDGAGQKTPISACEKHEAAWYQKYLMTLVPAVKQKTWYSSTMSTPWHCGLKKKWSTCRQFTPCQFVTFNCQSWKLEGISLGKNSLGERKGILLRGFNPSEKIWVKMGTFPKYGWT